MEHLAFCSMGKNSEYIRIRADNELKAALKAAAERQDRKESDQARFILRRALGLVAAEDEANYEVARGDPKKHPGRLRKAAQGD